MISISMKVFMDKPERACYNLWNPGVSAIIASVVAVMRTGGFFDAGTEIPVSFILVGLQDTSRHSKDGGRVPLSVFDNPCDAAGANDSAVWDTNITVV